jgi:hypothetical protein
LSGSNKLKTYKNNYLNIKVMEQKEIFLYFYENNKIQEVILKNKKAIVILKNNSTIRLFLTDELKEVILNDE